MLAERRQSLAPIKMADDSFEALPSLADELMTAEPAPTNEELDIVKKENAVLKSKVAIPVGRDLGRVGWLAGVMLKLKCLEERGGTNCGPEAPGP